MKAFDTVPHNRLMSVLEYYGVSDPILGWIKSFLSLRKQRVMVNGVPSAWHEVISGIPQGSVLGPVLFVVYINTIVDVIEHSDSFLFADDTKMSKGIFDPGHNMLLQEDIDNISRWSDSSLLRFHPDKMAAMRISKKHSDLGPPRYEMKGKPLKVSDEEKDLGVIIDSQLNFEKHMQAKINKANSIMGAIRRTIEYLDKENFKLLYTALVRPHLEYANQVWSPYLQKHITALENVQRRATRYIPGLKGLPYEDRLKEINLPTLAYRRYRGDMIETFKITHDLYDKEVTTDFLPMKKDKITRGHKYSLIKRDWNLNIRKNSFTYRIVDQWNNLPDSVVASKTVKCFESRLDKMWKSNKPEVVFNPDCNVRVLTSARSTRFYHTNTASNHAQPNKLKLQSDLMSEAS